MGFSLHGDPNWGWRQFLSLRYVMGHIGNIVTVFKSLLVDASNSCSRAHFVQFHNII
jgi:hypothetical protein